MSQPAGLRDNRLLAALPQEDAAYLLPHLEPVTWPLRTVLYEPACAPAFLYFPTTAMVSLIFTPASGPTAATGVVGCEGVVGVALVMGGASTPSQAMVQIAGGGFQLPAVVAHAEFERGGAFQAALLRYTQALLTQTAQTAICNRMHAIEQRLCRWLLLIHDRVPTKARPITKEFLAQMLAVRPETVTRTARDLHQVGMIRCGQGHITIVDRCGLEARACECYGAVQNEFTRLLGWVGLGRQHAPKTKVG
jgi:CRP-like cAMP-binding protein